MTASSSLFDLWCLYYVFVECTLEQYATNTQTRILNRVSYPSQRIICFIHEENIIVRVGNVFGFRKKKSKGKVTWKLNLENVRTTLLKI